MKTIYRVVLKEIRANGTVYRSESFAAGANPLDALLAVWRAQGLEEDLSSYVQLTDHSWSTQPTVGPSLTDFFDNPVVERLWFSNQIDVVGL